MLASIGPVAYSAVDRKEDSKYSHVRGCVLLDLQLDLPKRIIIKTPWMQSYTHDIVYTRFPDQCFQCKGRGHWAKNCPQKRDIRNPNDPVGLQRQNAVGADERNDVQTTHIGEGQETDSQQGFNEVVGRRRRGAQSQQPETPHVQMDNQFAVVGSEVPDDPGVEGQIGGERDQVVFGENTSRKKGVWRKSIRPASSDVNIEDGMETSAVSNEQSVVPRVGEYRLAGPASSSANKRMTLSERGRDGCREMIRINTDIPPPNSPRVHMSGLDQVRRVKEDIARRALLDELKKAKPPDIVPRPTVTQNQVQGRPQVVYDPAIGSKGGTALVVAQKWRILSSGTRENGRLAWCAIDTKQGPVNIASIYAPNKRRERIRFWRRIQTLTQEENWVILGDFNMVEVFGNSRGRTAVIRGSEERYWKNLAGEQALVDAFYCIQCRIGNHYTLQAVRDGRIDRARLDRVYLNKSASWLDHVQEVEHFPNKVLSDHGPVSVKLQLEPKESQSGPKANYFKLNSMELKDPETLRRVREAWEDEKLVVQDARRRWMRSWGRVRQLLRQIRTARANQETSTEALEKEIEWRTEKLADEGSDTDVAALRRAEDKLKMIQKREAERWRTHSRERWLKEGEAPTKYFMTRLKAKWARDAIIQMEDDTGQIIEDAEGIRAEVKQFYTDLYTAEMETEEGSAERRMLLNLVERRVSIEDNRELLVMPTREEIEGVVKRLKADKAPGYDGVTAEFLRECWTFVSEDCINMIQTVWVKRRMLAKDCQGVITLIP
ncbi:hypothetical protein R1sor_024354 [Riccia sorocarpa]|uniref:CCHC-type domain-containing protein n=1 Tax=Riccia sorocarpa TaxID=122646 RepID=A0ABD3GR18_9MARC